MPLLCAWTGFVTGHDFSRAKCRCKIGRASAPAGRLPFTANASAEQRATGPRNDNWLTTAIAQRPKVVDKLVSRERSTVAVPRNHRPQVAFSLRKCHLARLPERARELWNRSRRASRTRQLLPSAFPTTYRASASLGPAEPPASGRFFGDWPGLAVQAT
jgi:hypothetical protein